MARKDPQAASQTMQRAIEAKRLALGPTHPAVAESVLGLAAIHRASGRLAVAIELLLKELKFLMEEEKASSPGILTAPVMKHIIAHRLSAAAASSDYVLDQCERHSLFWCSVEWQCQR